MSFGFPIEFIRSLRRITNQCINLCWADVLLVDFNVVLPIEAHTSKRCFCEVFNGCTNPGGHNVAGRDVDAGPPGAARGLRGHRRKGGRADRRPAAEILTERQKKAIYDSCRETFELMGYER